MLKKLLVTINFYIMKSKTTIIFLFLTTIVFSQNIKPLTSFYTEYQPRNANEVLTPVYYKDLSNYFTPFIGTWTYQNGVNTFVVTIWKETQYPVKKDQNSGILYYTDELFGHYKLVQNFGLPSATVLYSSEINYLNSPTSIPTVIYGNSIIPSVLTGTIYDINTFSLDNYFGKKGILKMTIEDFDPITATWKITEVQQMGQYINFVIPTDIILTKQP
jgi:hypothetical protein